MLPTDAALIELSREASEKARPVIEAAEQPEADEAVTALRARVNELSEQLDRWLAGEVEHWLGRGKLVGVVGGDHSVAFGSIAVHAKRHDELGVLQIDAHADLRVAYQGLVGSHASVMHRVITELPQVTKLVQVGVRDYCQQEHERIVQSNGRIRTFFDADLAARLHQGEPFARLVDELVGPLPQSVYVSFDIDGLDPALCPHTGTPVPGGLGFNQASCILGAVVHSGRRIVGFDLCEVAPGPAGESWDANVGARVLYKLVGHALQSRSADR
jgi:agmatinase